MSRIATVSVADLRQRLQRAARQKGRSVDEAALTQVRALIGPRPGDGHRRDLLIEYLHAIHDAVGALPNRYIVALAHEMGLAMAQVYEVASFYHHFDLIEDDATPPRLTVRVCEGLSCKMAGQPDIAKLRQSAGPGVNVVAAPCVGRCEQAPAALVGQQAVACATESRIAEAIMRGAGRAQGITTHVDYEAYRVSGGYELARQVNGQAISAEDVLAALEHSGLRGLGGAGFPAGRKWRIVRDQAAPRMMAVNIDEGEPGTFKDRHYLERDPHRFLEGVLVAAQVVGIGAVYIYLRDEYHDCRVMLQAELAKLQANPPVPLPRIELRRGAGAYICGEESAMIESIEGKRGHPRMRPPYIAQMGLFGRPTLEHNFETLFWVRDIVQKGGDWFAGHGRHGRKGLRSFSVSGRVAKPGVRLAPAGVTLRELVTEFCGGMLPGHELYAYLPGGASGGILPASLADVPLDYDTLQQHGCFIGSAAVIVLSQHDRARDAALAMMRFFADESCGQCTPCRVGTAKAARLMDAPRWDLPTLGDLTAVMLDASICGLGQAAPNPLLSVQKFFLHEIE